MANDIPFEVVDEAMLNVHRGDCPLCEGPGPVDVHMSHEVWSALVMTSWKSIPHICCQSCGQKKRLVSLLGSLLLGWWGFPWGIIMTPIQIIRNIVDMVALPDTSEPSMSWKILCDWIWHSK